MDNLKLNTQQTRVSIDQITQLLKVYKDLYYISCYKIKILTRSPS